MYPHRKCVSNVDRNVFVPPVLWHKQNLNIFLTLLSAYPSENGFHIETEQKQEIQMTRTRHILAEDS